jgi:hypothetical protein
MPSIRTNRKYNKLSDTELSRFVGGTIVGFTGSTTLPDPPVAPAELTLQKTAYDTAITNAVRGGSLATSIKDAARAVIVSSLDKNASYVDINCQEDLTILLSSGYEAVSTNRSRQVLAAPVIVAVENGQAGQLRLRVTGDSNRRAIQGRIKPVGSAEFGPVITFQGSRSIVFDALSAGVSYVMQLIGLGGSTGQSDWSESVTKMVN